MAQIKVTGLTFGYEGSPENIFENVSFGIDTDWKLGFIGRNGKGKTTFLRLLLGELEYQGSIVTDACFDYFPFRLPEGADGIQTTDVIEAVHPDYELWKICRELELLQTDPEVLFRPFGTLSHGERTKVLLAVLFSRDNYFLLIDEPTNHLDAPTREVVRDYLNRKKGFILVSHDRWLLDGCIDHVLVLERSQIEVERGNFTTWQENKERRDQYEQSQNEKLKREIGKLRAAAERTSRWADKAESSKIGFDPVKDPGHGGKRAYIGEKSRKMQQRRKNLERRQQEAVEEKEGLLRNVEETVKLRLEPLVHYKEVLIRAEGLSLYYDDAHRLLQDFDLELRRGERMILQGRNGCGKTTLIRAVLQAAGYVTEDGMRRSVMPADEMAESGTRQSGHSVPPAGEPMEPDAQPPCGVLNQTGTLWTAAAMRISYINQDTSHLYGELRDYIARNGLNESLFKAVLRQIGLEREQFARRLEEYSEGQKKKVLIATSLITPAHLYIWDEPLNYIDVFARGQIEDLILQYQPTMLIVEHDRAFAKKCGTRIVQL